MHYESVTFSGLITPLLGGLGSGKKPQGGTFRSQPAPPRPGASAVIHPGLGAISGQEGALTVMKGTRYTRAGPLGF